MEVLVSFLGEVFSYFKKMLVLYLFMKRYTVQRKIGTDCRHVLWKHGQAVISKTKLKFKWMFSMEPNAGTCAGSSEDYSRPK